MRLTCRHQGLLGAIQEFALNYAVFRLRTYGSEAPIIFRSHLTVVNLQ